MSGPTTRYRTPSSLGAAGSSISGAPADARQATGSGYSGAVKPRARDLVGALILTIVLVLLVAYVVSLGAKGS